MPRDVFISYKTEDRISAERLCSQLESNNISCWIAPRDIPPGSEWATSIVEGIYRSNAMVLVLSEHSKMTKQIAREAELADKRGLPIVTFRLGPVEPPPSLLYFLGNVQWLDAFDDQFDLAVTRLVQIIHQSTGYPADKSVLRKAPTVQAPAPVQGDPLATRAEPSAQSPGSSTTTVPASKAGLWVGGGIVMGLILAVGLWFALRHPSRRERGAATPAAQTTPDSQVPNQPAPNQPRPSRPAPNRKVPPPAPDAKAVAERFVSEREAGNYDAAWGELTPEWRNTLDKTQWQQTAQKRVRNTTGHRMDGCVTSPPEKFLCRVMLFYSDNKSVENDLTVAPIDGGWGIAGSTFKTSY